MGSSKSLLAFLVLTVAVQSTFGQEPDSAGRGGVSGFPKPAGDALLPVARMHRSLRLGSIVRAPPSIAYGRANVYANGPPSPPGETGKGPVDPANDQPLDPKLGQIVQAAATLSVRKQGDYWNLGPAGQAPWAGPGNTTILATNSDPHPSSASFFNGYNESLVFWRLLQHYDSSNALTWEVKTGFGGQLYSLKALPSFNEIMGHQVGANTFIDRALQSIAVPEPMDGKPCGTWPACTYKIHQAGGNGPMSSTLLASQAMADGHGVSHMTWARQENTSVEWQDYRFRSNMYMQSHISDRGGGVLEFTLVWTNIGIYDITFIDLPWGALQYINFGAYALSTPNPPAGSPCPGCNFVNRASCDVNNPNTNGGRSCWDYPYPDSPDSGLYNCQNTDGWLSFMSANNSTAPGAFGVVFAPSAAQQASTGFKCQMRFGRTVDEPGAIDVNFLEGIYRDAILPPGRKSLPANGGTFISRFYIVLGGNLQNVATQAARVQSYMEQSSLVYQPTDVAYVLASDKVPSGITFSTLTWYALDKPVQNALPLIVVKYKTSGQAFITTTPYVFNNCTVSGSDTGFTCSYTGAAAVNPTDRTFFAGFIGWGIRCPANQALAVAPSGFGSMSRLSALLETYEFLDPSLSDPDLKTDVWVAV